MGSMILRYVFIGGVAVQTLYYLLVFARLNFVRSPKYSPVQLPPVSVLICAKNEGANLLRYLKVVLIQQYPAYEVVVVNDQSIDNTLEVVQDYQKRNPHLRLINIKAEAQKDLLGKKYALREGIKFCKHKHIVLTDADCEPESTQWLRLMMESYLEGTEIVLGYSPFRKENSWLNKLIRYENVLTAIQYFSYAKAGLPYMGTGRNLSYTKKVFEQRNKEAYTTKIASGDDDLLVNAAANSRNTEVCMEKGSFVYTEPKHSLKDWLVQKKRHLQAGGQYKWIHKVLLSLFVASNVGMYISFALTVCFTKDLLIVLALYLGLTVIRVVVFYKPFTKLESSDLVPWIPLLDVFYTFYFIVAYSLFIFKPQTNWK